MINSENKALLLTERWGGIFQKLGGHGHIGPLKQKSQGPSPPPPVPSPMHRSIKRKLYMKAYPCFCHTSKLILKSVIESMNEEKKTKYEERRIQRGKAMVHPHHARRKERDGRART